MKPTTATRLLHPQLELKQSREPYEQLRLGKPFAVKTTDDAKGLIEGHGAVFDSAHPTSSWGLPWDWQDVIRPGAFTDTLKMHEKLGTKPLMLYMHERGNVIGAWREVKEDGDGLFTGGQVHPAAKAPSDVAIYELLKMGALTGESIGFRVTKHTLDEKKKLREILEVELSEISIVDIPGGPKARITDVKSRDLRSPQFIEAVLRDAGLSRKEAKAFMAVGFSSLRDAENDDEPEPRDADPAGDAVDDESLAKLIHEVRASLR